MDSKRCVIVGAAGLLGVLSIACGIVFSMHSYNASNGGAYSALNHFISELGWMKKTPQFWAFSAGMLFGGVLCAAPIWLLGRTLGSTSGRLAASFGLFSALSGSCVGLLPMDWVYPHTLFAFMYFVGWLLSSAFFSKALLSRCDCRMSRIFGIYCLSSALTSLVFLIIPFTLIGTLTINGDLNQLLKVLETFQRPRVWPVAVMEWLVLLTSCVWCVTVSLCMLSGRSGWISEKNAS